MGAGTPVKQCAYPLASSELGCAVDGEGCSGSSGRQARLHRRTLCARGMDCKKHQPSRATGVVCALRQASHRPALRRCAVPTDAPHHFPKPRNTVFP